MPEYIPSHTDEIYGPPANPPALDKVVFTIDHIHMGGAGIYSTADVVSFLVKNRIPVTVFMECSDPFNLCKIDKAHAKEIVELDPDLVSLGVHALPKGNSQENQSKRLHIINDVIAEITGSSAEVLSYHGAAAGPEPDIVFAGIQYARGIKPWLAAQEPNQLDTPVMSLRSVEAAFRYTKLRNKAGLSATLFVHSIELKNSLPQKKVFDAFVEQVKRQRLQALDYYSAMELDFSSKSSCLLKVFTNRQLSQNLYLGHVDGSGEVFQVAELQNFLNELGFDAGEVDGTYGMETSMAVLMYQVDNQLAGDGQVGIKTRESINAYCD